MFASGIGNTDAGFILGTGKLLIKVPPTLKFNIVGEMPKYLLAKDLILQIIGEIGVSTFYTMFLVPLCVPVLSAASTQRLAIGHGEGMVKALRRHVQDSLKSRTSAF
jgi:homoaconitase/3-isopropylmalate dehydratase large subunit